MRNRGVIYRCYGDVYSEQCYHSVVSFRLSSGACRDYPIVVFDFNRGHNIWVEKIKLIPNVEVRSVDYEGEYGVHTDRHHRFAEMSSPIFKTILSADADTLFIKDPSRIFETAEKYGCARILDFGEQRIPSVYGDEMIDQLNAGVFCYTDETSIRIHAKYEEIIKSGYFQQAFVTKSFKGRNGAYRTGMKYDDGRILIKRDQPLLNTIVKKLGLQVPETLLPPQFNAQSLNDDTVVFHPYFRMRNNEVIMSIFYETQIGNQKLLALSDKSLFVYFGSPINSTKWHKNCFCVNEDSPIPAWILNSNIDLTIKFETWEWEVQSIDFLAKHIDIIKTIYGFGRIQEWKGLKTAQFNEILKRLVV